ncbi:HNH endonuclease [Dyadobacter frigoris]|uniref:HNH endonuclease n=1 Tax=Dyadobacter frigoris TaxID=2576211 RepID=A0A4U6D0Y5_9BACT|nr:HNH endonuclease [Dyadobacter frigoris]TKT87424.1 HNH endonuclease [Dyadobacter frigoris]GLU52326.1 hypothetical protein Dfri01_17870 [Dyadobacter frigoris]
MSNFRNLTPKRRDKRAECKKYSSYLRTLRVDFNKRCGYCDDNDYYRIRSFTIDHFIPQNPQGFIHNIKDNNYYNLVYSCRYCNSAKTNKWPTKDPSIHNDGYLGFVDPCSNDYNLLFFRTQNGQIKARDQNNALAKYIIQELNLWLPIHERMWKLEKLKIIHEEIKYKLLNIKDENLKKTLVNEHYEILKEIDETQSHIYMENVR